MVDASAQLNAELNTLGAAFKTILEGHAARERRIEERIQLLEETMNTAHEKAYNAVQGQIQELQDALSYQRASNSKLHKHVAALEVANQLTAPDITTNRPQSVDRAEAAKTPVSATSDVGRNQEAANGVDNQNTLSHHGRTDTRITDNDKMVVDEEVEGNPTETEDAEPDVDSSDTVRAELLKPFQQPASLSELASQAVSLSEDMRDSPEIGQEEQAALLPQFNDTTPRTGCKPLSLYSKRTAKLVQRSGVLARVYELLAKQIEENTMASPPAPADHDSPNHLSRDGPAKTLQKSQKKRRATDITDEQAESVMDSIGSTADSAINPTAKKKKTVAPKSALRAQSVDGTIVPQYTIASKSAHFPDTPQMTQTHHYDKDARMTEPPSIPPKASKTPKPHIAKEKAPASKHADVDRDAIADSPDTTNPSVASTNLKPPKDIIAKVVGPKHHLNKSKAPKSNNADSDGDSIPVAPRPDFANANIPSTAVKPRTSNKKRPEISDNFDDAAAAGSAVSSAVGDRRPVREGKKTAKGEALKATTDAFKGFGKGRKEG